MRLLQPTIQRGCEAKRKARSSPREKMRGIATNVYSRKTLEKPKRDLQILKIRVWKLFMHGKGISTPCVHHKEQQPLIECTKHEFKIVYFSFLHYLFIFLESTRVLPLPLRILGYDEEFRLM